MITMVLLLLLLPSYTVSHQQVVSSEATPFVSAFVGYLLCLREDSAQGEGVVEGYEYTTILARS